MATISITTDYKFNQKSAQKLVNAMERSENAPKVNKTNIKASRLKSKSEIDSLLKVYK
ncbi:hypothetical protein [Mammaliicoccus sciuri]|uniref:hypothetical protein n=1 Tax=Mammaliicoccus sciuri TaxID=1296 RepID=UPI001D0D1FFA|nr:hypothetical protein [Mammaliicoccus sciuri]MCC2090315.1 hypothetical protein [Mammaliicoccus sciuri]